MVDFKLKLNIFFLELQTTEFAIHKFDWQDQVQIG